MPAPQLRKRLPLVALAALLLTCSTAAAARTLAEAAKSPSEERNVTAQDGPDAAAAAAGTPSWLPAGTFSGDGTAYSEAVSDGTGFACSFRHLSPAFTTNFAAINSPMWDEGRACGRCLTAWCVDDRCKTRGKKVTVRVVDKCPECKSGDVDFSIPVYREITGMWPHRLAVQWEWTDCAPMVEGDMVLTPKDGINPFWQAWYISNAKYPIQSVKLNGKELLYNEFQFYINPGPLPDPATFTIQAVNGQTVNATVSGATSGEKAIPNFAS